MDLFRRKQKIIFWIVAIIIIPSFVLVWGVDRFDTGAQTGGDFSIGSTNGRELGYAEFDAFQRRIRAALGGLPLTMNGIPDADSPAGEVSKFLFVHALLEDAKKAGVTASDLQVGTYIGNSHPVITPSIDKADPASRDRAVDDFCRSMNLSRAELFQGIRDWQTIGNYIDVDSRLETVNDETVYAFYSLNKADVVIKRIRIVENDDLRALAKEEIMAKPEEERQQEARNFAAGRANNPRYRTPAHWRFSWVLVPFVPANSVAAPSEAEIQARYDAGRTSLFGDRPIADVREEIIRQLTDEEVERQTLRNFTVDVDPQLRNQTELPLDELVKLTQLAKYGVTAGTTGDEALPTRDAVLRLPDGTDMQLAAILEAVDTSPAAMRDSIVADLTAGYTLADQPYRATAGLYRIRLLNYEPSTPAPLDGADGKMNPELFELALEDMVGVRATEMAQEQAEATEERVRALMVAREDGTDAPDAEFADAFDAMPTDTIGYLNIADANYALGTLAIGDVLGPHPYVAADGERGQEIIVMVDRHVPSRATFAAEPEDVKTNYRNIALYNYRGGYGMTFTENGPTAFINPGSALMSGLLDRYYKGEIRVNPALTTSGEG